MKGVNEYIVTVGVYDANTGICIYEIPVHSRCRVRHGAVSDAISNVRATMHKMRFIQLVNRYGLTPTQMRELVRDGLVDLLKGFDFREIETEECESEDAHT